MSDDQKPVSANLFQPGNTLGRKAGVPNKTTQEIKEKLKQFVESELTVIMQRANELPLELRAKFLLSAISYFVPKRSISEKPNTMPVSPTLEGLTYEQILMIEAVIKGEPIVYQIENNK